MWPRNERPRLAAARVGGRVAALLGGLALMLAGLGGAAAATPAPLDTPMEASMNQAHSDALLSWQSRHDFAGTLEHLRGALADKGIRIFAEIDQAAAAADSGLTMPATVLILFGNPKAGTPVMLQHPLASVELPLRLVVRQAEDGSVRVDYLDAARLLERDYGVDDALLAPLARVPALLKAATTAN
jgi:uncharacterized protein (DUF302 family)